jgi:hypothetical protein
LTVLISVPRYRLGFSTRGKISSILRIDMLNF